MREIKNSYNHIQNIRARASTVLKDLEKKNQLSDIIKHEILSAKSIDAIDHLVCSKYALLYIMWIYNVLFLSFNFVIIVDSMHHLKRQAKHH